MNSEELEISLRTEFENYLKEIFVEMRQELSQLQEKVATEIERHKSNLDETFSAVMSRMEADVEIDAGFKDSVIEHLRLSRDEGARITAMAIAEAEDLEKESAPPPQPAAVSTGFKEIHEAVNDISTKTSQSEILKALVHHAVKFAPRGAFFIVKNEHLVGWRVFGKDGTASEEKIREVFLSTSSDSILSEAVKSLETVENSAGAYADDAELLDKLDFSVPQKMTAIPLVARGRGVAVLYADSETDSEAVSVAALETLTRVAGLTVEVLASAKAPAAAKKEVVKQSAPVETAREYSAPVEEPRVESSYQETIEPSYQETVEPSFETTTEPAFETTSNYQTPVVEPEVQPVSESPYKTTINFTGSSSYEEVKEEPVSDSYVTTDYQAVEETPVQPEETYQGFEVSSWSQPVEDNSWTQPKEPEVWTNSGETTDFTAQEYAQNFAKETDPTEYAKEFSFQPSVESSDSAESSNNSYQFESAKEDTFAGFESTQSQPVVQEENFNNSFEVENGKVDNAFTESFETVSQPVTATPPKSRLSERNVDLPIEVSEDERRLHNDARRFARLLVSEIKLYNEQKVKEGRDAGDIYERLREAIDRSREMYDKRVQPPVAAKFDYFHYELVNTLAEGDDHKLGVGYPGSAV